MCWGNVVYTGRKHGLSLPESFKVSQKFRDLSYLSVACSWLISGFLDVKGNMSVAFPSSESPWVSVGTASRVLRLPICINPTTIMVIECVLEIFLSLFSFCLYEIGNLSIPWDWMNTHMCTTGVGTLKVCSDWQSILCCHRDLFICRLEKDLGSLHPWNHQF